MLYINSSLSDYHSSKSNLAIYNGICILFSNKSVLKRQQWHDNMALNWSSFTIYYIYLTKLDSLSFVLIRFILLHYSIIHMTTDQNVSNVQTLFWQFELGRTLMFVFVMKLFCFTHSLIHLSLKVDHNNRVFRYSNGKMELDIPDVFDINCCVSIIVMRSHKYF